MVGRGVVAVSAPSILYGGRVMVSLAGGHGVMRMPIVVRIDSETVPVNDACFVQRVPVTHAQARTRFDPKQGIDEPPAVVLERVAQQRHRLAAQDLVLDGPADER